MSQDEVSEGTHSALEELGGRLVDALALGQGLNDFLHRFLRTVGDAFGTPRLVLYDHDETVETFELLCFRGYPDDARYELARRLRSLDVERALRNPEPFRHEHHPEQLVIPLYFQSILEAVLVVEFPGPFPELSPPTLDACHRISRFLGLFMSSNRLPVNQGISRGDTHQLRRAREVQMAYLPNVHPATERYEIYGYNQSSALVGGDYFDYFRHRPQSIQCVVADACGHGLAAALIMSNFRGLLHSEMRRGEDPANLFLRLNREVCVGGEVLQYLTAVFFDFDEQRNVLSYFNAGHFDPILLHADGQTSRLEGGGPPLGMFPEAEYAIHQVPVKAGDMLVVFTDGLVELANTRQEFFGQPGILNAIQRSRRAALKDLAADVLARAAEFSGTRPPADDLTLFLMRFR